MAKVIDIVVPDGVSDAAVVEIMQQVGSRVAEEQSLLAIETDKATAEVPAPATGKLLELSAKEGDTVSSGTVLGKLEVAQEAEPLAPVAAVEAASVSMLPIVVPDGVSEAVVVEIMQSVGAVVAEDVALIAVETDKATAEIPAPKAGTIAELAVKEGDTVSSGAVIGQLQVSEAASPASATVAVAKVEAAPTPVPNAQQPNAQQLGASVAAASPANATVAVAKVEAAPTPVLNAQQLGASIHASPSVRQFARELGVDLSRIREPSGPKGRITFGDVKGLVKTLISAASSAGLPVIELPDFSKFGPTEEQALSKIKQITGEHLSKGWLNIPLVTHFEEADITELEDFRQELNQRPAVGQGDRPKTTALAFIVRAVVKALQQFPQVNSSLSGKSLILKKYYHIGIAVDTPRGLLVPVIREADQLSLDQISQYIKELGSKGRSGKLGPADMEGGSFTISSLGGLGGTNFTPLVNPPEAAILGVAKSALRPVWNGREFMPRLILPFSISYDHRILDGGEVARFGAALAGYLKDLRYILV